MDILSLAIVVVVVVVLFLLTRFHLNSIARSLSEDMYTFDKTISGLIKSDTERQTQSGHLVSLIGEQISANSENVDSVVKLLIQQVKLIDERYEEIKKQYETVGRNFNDVDETYSKLIEEFEGAGDRVQEVMKEFLKDLIALEERYLAEDKIEKELSGSGTFEYDYYLRIEPDKHYIVQTPSGLRVEQSGLDVMEGRYKTWIEKFKDAILSYGQYLVFELDFENSATQKLVYVYDSVYEAGTLKDIIELDTPIDFDPNYDKPGDIDLTRKPDIFINPEKSYLVKNQYVILYTKHGTNFIAKYGENQWQKYFEEESLSNNLNAGEYQVYEFNTETGTKSEKPVWIHVEPERITLDELILGRRNEPEATEEPEAVSKPKKRKKVKPEQQEAGKLSIEEVNE